MRSMLTCDACGVTEGPFYSYEEWEDGARRLGWVVGEDVVLCPRCAAA